MTTLGQSRVRVSFNPSANNKIDTIKQLTAELIDLCATLGDENGEKRRLIALANTEYENAAMWTVKAATIEVK